MKFSSTILLLCLSSFLFSQNLFTGLQACYLLDGNANNSAVTGSALNGVLVGGSMATGHTGLANTGYSLSGTTSSYIELPDHPGLKSSRVFFTGWFKFSSLSPNQYMVYTKSSCFNYFEAYALNAYYNGMTSQYSFVVTKSSSSCFYAPQVPSTTPVQVGTWYHVGFFVTDTVIKLYVNGVLEASTPHTVMFDYVSGKNVYIGVTNESNYNLPCNMTVDNMRFYNRELTATEVLSLFNQDAPCIAPPIPTATFSASKKQICRGQSINFTDQSTNNPVSWNWQFPGGSPATSTLSNPVVLYPSAGNYTVSMIATNTIGPSSVVTTSISVSECISIDENEKSGFEFYPNPSAGKLIVNELGSNKIQLFDVTGKIVRYNATKLNNNSLELDLSACPNGVYFMTVSSAEGLILQSSKIILQK